jgi:hypothetical protein
MCFVSREEIGQSTKTFGWNCGEIIVETIDFILDGEVIWKWRWVGGARIFYKVLPTEQCNSLIDIFNEDKMVVNSQQKVKQNTI